MMSDSGETIDAGFGDPAAVYVPGGEASDAVPVTVAVNQEVIATPGFTREGYEAAKALVPMPRDFGVPQMTALARDLAMDLLTVDAAIHKHGLSNAQYELLRDYNEYFKKTLAQQAAEWQGIGSTQDRLRAQAAAALEEQLPVLASRMGKQSEKLIETVEAAKLFAKIAGVDGDAARTGGGGERFTINIDLGADTRLILGAGSGASSGHQSKSNGEIPAGSQG